MFLVELWYGFEADSSALLADAADFLSDSLSYVITLFVLGASLRVRAGASMLKGMLMLGLGVLAISQGLYHAYQGNLPDASTMGWVSVAALAVNTASALLLYSSRGRDSNMLSVWLCSRNDAINNALVIVAAFIVMWTQSIWPDLIVAAFIAWLEGSAAWRILIAARKEWRQGA